MKKLFGVVGVVVVVVVCADIIKLFSQNLFATFKLIQRKMTLWDLSHAFIKIKDLEALY